ncbi:MAG TPA: thioredoxin domain-containing protein [Pyrinomonadaceae bacterium]|nr:thioredoxin domain-containing protein [Pyrinomonadaceae bacterium]
MSQSVSEVTDATFEREVLEAGGAAVVDFGAPWCPPCRAMEPIFAELGGRFDGSARFFKLNIDDNPAVAQRYGVKGIPTFIVFDGGREVERVVGAIGKEALARIVSKYATVAA